MTKIALACENSVIAAFIHCRHRAIPSSPKAHQGLLIAAEALEPVSTYVSAIG